MTTMTTDRPTGIKCGNCKGRHENVAEVRKCYGAAQPTTGGRLYEGRKPPQLITLQAYPDVPAGHYATPSRTGTNDLDFWRVDRPTEGRWAGYTFVKRVIGGHPDHSVRGTEARLALQAILNAGIKDSAQLYGQTIGRCSRCNRHLTDETSRQYGMGPECRSR